MSVTITIKAVPSSGRQALERTKLGIIKCYLKSPAERGKANSELIKFLAKKLDVPQQDIELLMGHTDRNKVVRIQTNLDQATVFERLGLPVQASIFEQK